MATPECKFKFGKDNSANFTIQRERDGRIIAAVQRYPVITLALLRHVLPAVPYRVLAARCAKLSEQGEFFAYKYPGELLAYSVWKWPKEGRKSQLPHALDITKFMLVLDLALEPPVEIIDRTYDCEAGKKLSGDIVPDAGFTLRHRRDERFSVEIDRANMPIERSDKRQTCLLEKGLAYARNKEGGRVLIVTQGAQRAENIVQAFYDYEEPRRRDDPYAADVHPLRSGRFLVCTQEQFSVEQPATILGPIWRSPKVEGWQSLIS